jgi:beta-galactosidase
MFPLIRRAFSLFFIALFVAASAVATKAVPIEVRPEAAQQFAFSLNGPWSFKYIPSLAPGADAGFHAATFDASAWKTLTVPANWELEGFGPLGYDKPELKDGLGLYRRLFRVTPSWSGRRVCLRFEGVAYGFTVWVNGQEIGASTASAYDRHTFDITDALHSDPQTDNVVAVQVTTKPFGWEFDVNDDWSLSGIYRDVTLFSVPFAHVRDLTATTKVTPDGKADLDVSVIVNQPGAKLRGKLLAPDGKTVREFKLEARAGDTFGATVRVTKPKLWTAETPSLYRLQVTLSADGQPPQTVEQTIGLREVSIRDGVLLLNHRPIKLRGVNYHHLDPVRGRAITEADMRRDLELMRKANINHVRTAHYPPAPRLLELCDEMGFYVMDEAALGSRGYKLLKDPAYRDHILARTKPPILRDKNHASVIVWSIGNENPYEPVGVDAARYAKELDPTRPVCLPQTPSHFEESWRQFPEFLDNYSPHYPTNTELRGHAKNLKRPTIYSEFAHSWGLAFDQLQDQWDIMQATPEFTGGAIWMFQDQGLLRKSSKPFDPKKVGAVWLDDKRFYDTHDGDGADGIVYSDRTPQSDYWQTRKVFSPVQISKAPPS